MHEDLLARNVAWANERVAEDPGYFKRLSNIQRPEYLWIGCADSRVAAEIVFDQGLGDMFVVRTAGHVIDSAVLGSIEYAVTVLNVPLVVVLGHDTCGAVNAALSALDNGVLPEFESASATPFSVVLPAT